MRLIGWVLLILVGVGWLASEVPLAESRPNAPCQDNWRRTAQGWEDSSTWHIETKASQPAMHPAVIGLLQLFLVIAALIAFSNDKDRGAQGRRSARFPGS